MIGSRMLTEIEALQQSAAHFQLLLIREIHIHILAPHSQADQLEGELVGELENGRLVRLLCKFGFINERPE
jgi:Pan3 Pseudokinase domain